MIALINHKNLFITFVGETLSHSQTEETSTNNQNIIFHFYLL